jgi:hypothetical protein
VAWETLLAESCPPEPAARPPNANGQKTSASLSVALYVGVNAMDVITHYANEHHRTAVAALWDCVFGYETAHNAPTMAIDNKFEFGAVDGDDRLGEEIEVAAKNYEVSADAAPCRCSCESRRRF